jgi:uncharacterized protein DUF4190/uncharacterized protein DUF4339
VYKIIGADGKEYGPISAVVLRQWLTEGRANGQTRVLAEGSTEWKPMAEVPELAALLTPPMAAPIAPITPGPISLAPTPRNNLYAAWGLGLGIASLTVGLCCCYGFPFSIPGIVCSVIALNQIKEDPNLQRGKGMATAGLILSILSIVLGFILIFVAASFGTPDMWRRIRRL